MKKPRLPKVISIGGRPIEIRTKRIHYFDWDSPYATLCGVTFEDQDYIAWVTKWKKVTCKNCLRIRRSK